MSRAQEGAAAPLRRLGIACVVQLLLIRPLAADAVVVVA
jgi:hypothetical protein